MIELGMPVWSRDGHWVGCVEAVLEDGLSLPPGIVIARSRVGGLFNAKVALTTYDVRDVRGGVVLLRITRWDVWHRAGRVRPTLRRRLPFGVGRFPPARPEGTRGETDASR